MPPTPSPVDERVAVIGLGFVGLQVAVAFGRVQPTVGYDVDPTRVERLCKGQDRNGETRPEDLASPLLEFTSDSRELADCDVYIVAVPTPVDRANRPDLGPLKAASRAVGEAMRARGARGRSGVPLVVYESSTYPGCTEEDCVPVVQEASGLRAGVDFKVGYSPERINPGDPEHRFETIRKVVSGQDAATLERVAGLYRRVVPAGVYRAPDIRTAEAAKIIENTQRDLNIALMNELAIIFHRMGIDTQEVLAAARTKWNFLPFAPGLVGGHCIPVDPYYLTHKAEELGYFPEVILAGRRINDGMGAWVAREALKRLSRSGRPLQGARALVLGATFKEDVPDARNSRVLDLVRELEAFGVATRVHDALLGPEGVQRLGFTWPEHAPFDGAGADGARYQLVVLAVPHRAYREASPAAYAALLSPGHGGLVADVRGALPREELERAGAGYWRV